MNRRSMLKALAVVPAAAVTGPSGVAALAGAVVGTAITRPPRPITKLRSGDIVTAAYLAELVDAVNHANGFTRDG